MSFVDALGPSFVPQNLVIIGFNHILINVDFLIILGYYVPDK